MSTTKEPLGAAEITGWLNQTAQRLNHILTGATREAVIAELRADVGDASVSFRMLAMLALLDDCLRVAHLAIEADGVIDERELARVSALASVAAPRYFAAMPGYEGFGEAELSDGELVDFLRAYRHDSRPLGHAGPGAWRGLRLCQRVAAHAQDEALVRDHERMLVRIMDTVFAGASSSAERTARQRLRTLFEQRGRPGVDPRVAAFCRADGPEVFSSVAHGSQIFERDPFDVESIHADARAVFQSQLEHAITPTHHEGGHGRTLLVLGAAGSGKTHLLRALRTVVHERRLGYVGYLQMSSDVGDYSRYVLTKLIDSLERPYDAPELMAPSLLYLSDGLTEHGEVLPADAVERLRNGVIEPGELPGFIGRLVDRLTRTEALQTIDSDLLQALLLLQRRDPAMQRRIVKFLRCESLTSYEQELLGGLAPRLQPEDPARTLEQLGALAFAIQQAALVLLVDQIEDAIPDARGHERIQRAIDAVRRVADALPSAVVVIACLDDVYDQIRGKLNQSLVDRLERDPAPVRLSAQRSRDEIETMLIRRLEYLFDTLDVAWRDDDPLFPFRATQLDDLSNQRARDCLAFFRRFQEQSIAAGELADATTATPASTPELPPPAIGHGFDDLDRAWNDALVSTPEAPDDDAELLRLLEEGVRACAEETGMAIDATFESRSRPRLTVALLGRAAPVRVVEICNRPAQGGRLGAQLDALRRAVAPGEMAVALRTSEFSFGPRTVVMRTLGELVAAGGLALAVEDGDLRATLAFDDFARKHGGQAGFADWRARRQPLARLAVYRKLLDLDRVEAKAAAAPKPEPAPEPAPRPRSTPMTLPPPPDDAPVRTKPGLRLGVTPTMRAEPVMLPLEILTTHAAVLGSTGSGKTTVALNVVEQLLERGISVLLLDRKGDLARYASPDWWDEVPADPELARRKRALRERVDVDLYTPGEASGRPLRIPIVPSGMHEMSTQERDQVAKIAAAGLGAMIGYGKGEGQRRREAILKKAIELHAERHGATLDDLRDTIFRPDPELLAAVGNLTRHFSAVAEDLDMLKIQRDSLLSGEGELLDVNELLATQPGRARLSIISAVALTDVSVLQFWVSRLLVDLARHVRRHPSATLRSVAFFDEADTYVPATSQPPTKAPMFELLRRARSGGMGIFLGSQNPGDFDYKARDNIGTWLVGRVTQDRAIEKMKHLIAGYPNVGVRLANQGVGSFFLLNPTLSATARELRADAAMMKTVQIPEDEIARLARQTLRGRDAR